MVQLTLKVRPQPGYSSHSKLKEVQVDSSDRVEEIISKLKLEKKGTNGVDSSTVWIPSISIVIHLCWDVRSVPNSL